MGDLEIELHRPNMILANVQTQFVEERILFSTNDDGNQAFVATHELQPELQICIKIIGYDS